MTVPTTLQWGKIVFLSTALALCLVILPTMVVAGVILYRVIPPFLEFCQLTEQTPKQLLERFQHGLKTTPPTLDGSKFNLVLLGTDALPTRPNQPVMTDTIMVASIDLTQATVKLVSLPRDLWSEQFRAKINTLYEYGKKQQLSPPEQLLLQEIQTLSGGIPIHATLTISPWQLAQLIDAVGGLEITVPIAFLDKQFPRTDVDVTTEKDPQKLYTQIAFSAGTQQMTGEQALAYMRSRHGTNGQDNDLARNQRQQLVLSSLASRLTQLATKPDPATIATIWNFYQTHYQAQLPVEQLLALAKYRYQQTPWQGKLLPTLKKAQMFRFQAVVLPVSDYSVKTRSYGPGLIYHPQNLRPYFGQWVYVVKEPTQLTSFIRDSLEYNTP